MDKNNINREIDVNEVAEVAGGAVISPELIAELYYNLRDGEWRSWLLDCPRCHQMDCVERFFPNTPAEPAVSADGALRPVKVIFRCTRCKKSYEREMV